MKKKKCANLDNPDTKWDVIMLKGWGERKRGRNGGMRRRNVSIHCG